MKQTLSVTIPDSLDAAIERIGANEGLEKRAVTRQLLQQAVREHERQQAFERYQDGDLTTGQLAEEADLSLRGVLMELRERGIHFSYSKQSLREDFRGH